MQQVNPLVRGIIFIIAELIEFLADGDGLVGLGGIEALLVIEFTGIGKIFETVLLVYDCHPVLLAVASEMVGNPAAVVMTAGQGVGQDRFAAS